MQTLTAWIRLMQIPNPSILASTRSSCQETSSSSCLSENLEMMPSS